MMGAQPMSSAVSRKNSADKNGGALRAAARHSARVFVSIPGVAPNGSHTVHAWLRGGAGTLQLVSEMASTRVVEANVAPLRGRRITHRKHRGRRSRHDRGGDETREDVTAGRAAPALRRTLLQFGFHTRDPNDLLSFSPVDGAQILADPDNTGWFQAQPGETCKGL
jgi:hypothetical protein